VSRRNLLQSIFLIVGARPSGMRRAGGVRSVNAAIVGLLLAALYQPVWRGAVSAPGDFGLALATFVLREFWQFPP